MEKDRELLFGVLAVQLKLVSPQQLMESAAIWATSQKKPLSEILAERGFLNVEKKKLIEELLEMQVKEHAGNIQSTLQSFGGDRAIYESFAGSILVEKGEVKLSAISSEPSSGKPVKETIDDSTRLAMEQPGRYSIKGEHDRGGIGRIMIAFDETVGREIAVKELLPETGVSGTPASDSPMRKTGAALARFLREARITGQLEHPGIVPVYEIGKKSDGSIYYTMKFIRGSNFSAKLKEYKNLQERLRLLPNFLSLCQAVAYAHSRGVIHRDIKPANVLIGEFGETVLLDWGLAKVKGLEDIRASQLSDNLRLLKSSGMVETSAGLPLGTPAYMSPEQAEGKIEAIDERSDVWCLGAFLYEIATGCLPFTGKSALDVMGKIMKDPMVPVAEIEPKVPAELCAIAEKCLQKEPRDRYQSAEELADDLGNFLSGGLVGAFEYPIWKLIFRWLKGHWKPLVLGTSGAIAGLVFLLCLLLAYLFNFTERINFNQEDINAFDKKAETARLEKLIKLPDGPGNAATDLMKAIHYNMVDYNTTIWGKTGKSLLPYPWIEQLKFELLKSNKKEDQQNLAEWSKIPEVDVFRNAAKRGYFQMWGVEVFPGAEFRWWNMPIPYYLDFLRLSILGIARAQDLEKQGKNEEAVAWYHDLIIIGNYLENELYAGEVVGLFIKIRTSGELYQFYLRQGNQPMAGQWKEYNQVMEKRLVCFGNLNDPNIWYRASEEDLKRVVENQDLYVSIRLNCYEMLMKRMRFSNPRRLYLGPNDEEKQFLLGNRYDEPLLKLRQVSAAEYVNSGFIRRLDNGIGQIKDYFWHNLLGKSW